MQVLCRHNFCFACQNFAKSINAPSKKQRIYNICPKCLWKEWAWNCLSLLKIIASSWFLIFVREKLGVTILQKLSKRWYVSVHWWIGQGLIHYERCLLILTPRNNSYSIIYSGCTLTDSHLFSLLAVARFWSIQTREIFLLMQMFPIRQLFLL